MARRQRQRSRPSNFMSMSDDEDELDLDEMIASPPTSISAPAPNTVQPGLLDILHEEEDIVVPSSTPSKRLSSPPSSKRSRSRRGTLESLLSPLTNFIDFREDDRSSRSWRSFVEIS